MTDKEMIMHLIESLEQKIYVENNYLEVENTSYGENICFEFNEDGKLIKLYS